MGIVHYASLFKYREYQREVAELVAQADQENYELLKERVVATIREFQHEWPLSDLGMEEYKQGMPVKVLTQEWPLLEHGDGALSSIEGVNAMGLPAAPDLGEWFLIILAKYLSPAVSPGDTWYILSTVLQLLGWSKSHCELLFQGRPTHLLLKPRLKQPSGQILTAESPYWLWIRPSRARSSGWLSIQDVVLLHERLSSMKRQVEEFDIRKMPNIDVDNPIVIQEYQEFLWEGFDNTLTMLTMAKDSAEGLFMTIVI